MGIDRFPSTGPSQSQSVNNVPSISRDEELIVPQGVYHCLFHT
jgi:hypothetical protein